MFNRGSEDTKDILVIDDNKDSLLLMQLILEQQGHRTSLACCGKEGLFAIDTTPPDLVILDLMMPDMSGLDLIEILKKDGNLRNIPILLLTANIKLGKEDVTNADEVCHKPFEIDNLLIKIKSLLVRDRHSRALALSHI